MRQTYEEVHADATSIYKETKTQLQIHTSNRQGTKHHCEIGPGCIVYNVFGDLWSKVWFRHGKPHRTDGFAVFFYEPGKVFSGDTRTLKELEEDLAVRSADKFINGRWVPRELHRALTEPS